MAKIQFEINILILSQDNLFNDLSVPSIPHLINIDSHAKSHEVKWLVEHLTNNS